jgi:hypothetical protein
MLKILSSNVEKPIEIRVQFHLTLDIVELCEHSDTDLVIFKVELQPVRV